MDTFPCDIVKMMNKKAHCIGICGMGMASTAILLKDAGYDISGSDDGFYPPASNYLKENGISFSAGYRKENIPDDADLIIIGKNAKLVPEKNEEVRHALASGIPIKSFPEVLGEYAKHKENIVVAGSYAKSTCSALLSWCLLRAKKDPGYFIGALPVDMQKTARVGTDDTFIFEGDEYPSANWDRTSKFLHYHPHDVLLTAASHDHVNIFPTQEHYIQPYRELLAHLPEDGLVITSADEAHARALANEHKRNVVLFGFSPKADYRPASVLYGDKTTFLIKKHGRVVARIETPLLGKHNVLNIVGVATLLFEKKLISQEAFEEAVKIFRGIKRRLDRKTNQSSILVYEGFGSSYDKARVAIEAMKLHFPDRRLFVIFEPHAFSWRNKNMIHWYDDIFTTCDRVFVGSTASQGAETHEQLRQDEIVARIKKGGVKVAPIDNPDACLSQLKKQLRKNDVILLLTSGNLGGLVETVPKLAEQLFPQQYNEI